MRTKLYSLAALVSTCTFGASAHGVELLLNKDLNGAASPPGWTQSEFVTGEPGTAISLSEQLSTGNSPNDPVPAGEGNGIELRPFFGNVGAFEDQNKQINFTLVKDYSPLSAAPVFYTLTGDVFLGEGYSGAPGNEFLDPYSPSDPGHTGTVPSPTNTNITLTFLNASNVVQGSPIVHDLRTNTLPEELNSWKTHTVVTPATPAGATKLRIAFNALNMVDNDGDPADGGVPRDQAFHVDYFTLKRSSSPTIDLIGGNDASAPNPQNGHLNIAGPPADWNLVERFSDLGNTAPVNSAAVIFFANHDTVAQPTGQGLWLRAFQGGFNTAEPPVAIPVDAIMSQTAAAVAGGMYTFSAWTVWEGGFAGDTTMFPASPTDMLMRMEFLNASNAVIGSPIELDLYAAGMRSDADGGNIEPEDWRQFMINGTAPANTASVRVTMAALEMINSGTGTPLSAFFDDFSLEGPAPGAPADFNGDGDVDGRDFLIWQRNSGTTSGATKATGDADGNFMVNDADFNAWKSGFGAAVAATGAVPEPASAATALIAAALVGWRRERRRAIV